MTINDIPKGTNLGQVRVRTSDGQEGWWVSQWSKGVWLTDTHPESTGTRRLRPVFMTDLAETLDWEVLEIINQPQPS